MSRRLMALAALTALTALPALADEPNSTSKTSYDATSNGGYDAKSVTQSTDAAGTTTTEKAVKSVDVKSNGDKTTTVDVKNTVDPKGLMNKKTTEVKNKAVETNGKTEYMHTKTVNGKTVESTDDTQKPAQ